MKFKHMTWVLFVIALFLGREYLVLRQLVHGRSLLWWIHCHAGRSCQSLSVAPGRALGHGLGWLGLFFILLTGFYSIRKRWGSLQERGNIQDWLKWHMAFGLLGPLFIVFHTNFRAGGLVAVSFWSMVAVVISGIIGRFFYMQLLSSEAELVAEICAYEVEFEKYRSLSGSQMSRETMEDAKLWALWRVGCEAGITKEASLAWLALHGLAHSFLGLFGQDGVPSLAKPSMIRLKLVAWATLRRRLLFAETYKKIMGYWHAIHLPFTYLMMVTVIIHLVSSLVFTHR